jgi:multidrug efflux pump subunit AcrA (membrane-fusion protein)
VTVKVVTEAKRGALAVPVTALVALSGGGYALEVDRAGQRTLVPVTPGAFADGYVEVSGRGVTEGTRVVVAS